jgi:gliding motility-associated-like protein
MAGTYNVTVTDTNACSVTTSAIITEPALLSVSATITDVSCNPGPADGTITAVGAGGVTSYTFSATDGTNNYNSANGYFTALSAGTYTVNVTDNNSCSATTTATINQPTQLVPQVLPTDVSCYHYTNGVITATATGGALGYMYEFSTGLTNTTGILQGVPAGVYAVTITDANGCYVVDSAEVTEPDTVLIQVSPNPVEVKLGNTLQINTTTNQSGTVTYNWAPAFGLSCYDCPDPMFDGNYSQPYTVVATTADGCMGTSSLTVTVVPNYDIFFPNAFTPNGDGTNDYWQMFGNMSAVKQIDVKVFNRIGEMVFEGRDIDFKWDGTYKGAPVQNGVFVYVAKIVWINNESDNGFKGTITVIR